MRPFAWYMAGAWVFTKIFKNKIIRYPVLFACGFVAMMIEYIGVVNRKDAFGNSENI